MEKKLSKDVVKQKIANFAFNQLFRYFIERGPIAPEKGLGDTIVNDVKKKLVLCTYHYCKGNQVKTARYLGWNRNTIRKILKSTKEPE